MKNICCKSLRYLRPYFLNIYTKTIKFIIGTNIYIIGNSKNRNKRNIIRPKATEYKKHIPKNIMLQVLLLITIPRNDINNNMIAAIKVSMDLNDKSQILCTAQKNGIVNWQCKINCVTHYLSLENSSVGERPAPRGGTTRPDERKITII